MVEPRTLVDRVLAHGARPAIVDSGGVWSYDDLATGSGHLAARLLDGRADLDEERVALLCAPGHDFVVAALACWRAGAMAVPLDPAHPEPELAYALDDAAVTAVVASPAWAELARRASAGRRVETVTDVVPADDPPRLPVVDPDRAALMVYTSGTTGRPKGVVHTHRSVAAQVTGLIEAWAWAPDDRILLVLPLHHVHGIVNVTFCALWAGAVCEAPGGFDAIATWERLASGALTLFMAVPTVYARLIAAWESASDGARREWSAGARGLRLMVSGSAALPVSTLARWEEITGHVLLERYGMTEIGMALSNTLDRRVPGHVGRPLPGMEVRIVDDAGRDLEPGAPGELLVRGAQVFREYWGRPDATQEAFDDGWFRTGDVAVCEPEGHRLLGRSSVDIIKTGGEKVSALEVEETYREHPGIADCAVVGVPDDEWGERVCAAVVAAPLGDAPTAEDLRAWGKQRLAVAKVPTRYLLVDELPRNAMGKVTKPAIATLFTPGFTDPTADRAPDRTQRFAAIVTVDGKGRVHVPIPFDPDAVWGPKPRHHVTGSLDGRRLRGVIDTDPQRNRVLVLGPAWACDDRPASGADVDVVLQPEGPQRADLAPDIAAALDAAPDAAAFFDSLAQFYRNAYLRWIDATKRRPDVRAQRIAETVRLLEDHQKERPKP